MHVEYYLISQLCSEEIQCKCKAFDARGPKRKVDKTHYREGLWDHRSI